MPPVVCRYLKVRHHKEITGIINQALIHFELYKRYI